MSTHQEITALVGDQIGNDPEIRSLVEQLSRRVEQLTTQIREVKGPQPSCREVGQAWVERTGKIRGRPLHYQFVGSGAGRSSLVELMDGSVKIDLINGIGIHLFGHSFTPAIREGILGAISDVVNQGNLEPNREYTLMLEKLVSMASRGSRIKYGWLATCGTMANESALKIARQKKSPARMILAFQNAFAGRSTLMAEITDNPAFREGLPEYHEVLRLPWYDYRDPSSSEKTLRVLKEHVEKHPNNICVFVFEPMLGEGGYMPAPREFFLPLLEFCRSQKIPIWLDEVQTFCRTGEAFAFQKLGLGEFVDIVTVAKTAQVGATLYTEEYNPKPGLIAGTFSGSSAALRSGLAILNEIDNGTYFGPGGKIEKIHQFFVGELKRLQEGSCRGKIADVTGLGLMVAFTPLDGKKETVNALLQKMFEKGVIAFSCGKNPVRIRFLLPALISEWEMSAAIKIIEQALIEGVHGAT
ncbi:MAG: aminotransferase class III-fold pyridoxal phosphate-dependent enzyme [Bdellovibrionaceae bacterium]|nr:aminotransferase class III-fold pyridoxal phosphate-dependent enzyme [Pseudobdellovibrionaceae bacterium]MDW8189785.1 aminotransferase class III-fold pyridoxal phosphate-dependent enzyme [Pseudobdellovibrionaceae bacterium]